MRRSPRALAGLLLAAAATSVAGCGRSALDIRAGNGGGAGGTAGSSSSAAGTAGSTVAAAPSATLPDGTCVRNASPVNGACTCTLGTPTICPGTCVDLPTDADHCGACDRACGPTAGCIAGVCGASPSVLVPARPNEPCGQLNLAVADGGLAWTETRPGVVRYMFLSTGKTLPLSSVEKAPTRPSVRGTDVFWLNRIDPSIRRSNVEGGATNSWVTSGPAIGGYVVSPDGGSVYYSIQSEIHQLPRGSAAPLSVATFGKGLPAALALSGDELVATVGGLGYVAAITLIPGAVARCDAFDAKNTAPGCVRLANGDDIDDELILLLPGSHTIFAQGRSLLAAGFLTYGKASIAFGVDPISGFAADDDWVYYATTNQDGAANGTINRVASLPTQVGGVLARGQLAPRSLATDGKRLFWSTSDCAIHTLDL